MKQLLRRPVFWIVIILLGALAAFSLMDGGDKRTKLQLSRFQDLAAAGKVRSAEIVGTDNVRGELTDGSKYEAKFPAEYADELTTRLLGANVDVGSKDSKENIWVSLLLNFLPILLLFGGFLFIINSMQGGGSKVMQFGKAKARLVSKDEPKVTFADVAGADEAIAELMEIKDFLESPAKFQSIGAKIPKGVLLYGPPGTGKTLLAKAVAGEAGVPFFSISGSDFVEMFVGVGASRVRDLFQQAKANPPAIIFMDEIDAVGRHRGAGMGGGHDEREQTLNQLLVEMDGFDTKAGVILLAATNRPDILDPALLRPGRFDRQIVVDRPDLEGRKKILAVHARGKPLEDAIDLEVLARRTPGFTGADLANLMNEAALLSARSDRKHIGMLELEDAIDRVIGGPERKTRVMSEKEKLVIAYHEGGHALVGHVLPHADPVHKVSIVARGRALGWTLSLPTEDKYIVSRSELRDQLGVLLGGRTAEELIFSEITTGAANDIEKATEIARAMVTQYGMSDALGPQQLGQQNGEVFLGRDFGHQPNYSDEVASRIDAEVRGLIDDAHDEALSILTTHRATLDKLAAALMEKETLDTPALMEILGDLPPWAGAAKPPPPPRSRPTPPDPGPSPEARPPAIPVGLLTRWRRVTGKPATA
ncbi:MAG: ATP-dependent zinc metalloprotease FtsH [Actinomycetota bacterium]|nr:ATP-dependent zinc metalloprotease FtsH [Actinomycetota bacterium]